MVADDTIDVRDHLAHRRVLPRRVVRAVLLQVGTVRQEEALHPSHRAARGGS
jgi:hypothetical protein